MKSFLHAVITIGLLLYSYSSFAGIKLPRRELCIVKKFDSKTVGLICNHKNYDVPLQSVVAEGTQLKYSQKLYVYPSVLKNAQRKSASTN